MLRADGGGTRAPRERDSVSATRARALDRLSGPGSGVLHGGWPARLFQDGDAKVPLRLADSKTFSTGVLSLTYRPAGG